MEEIMKTVTGLMALAARTAPKAVGKDYLEMKILSGEEVQKLAAGMLDYGEKKGKKNYDRDGDNVRRSDAVLLLSLFNPEPAGLNCGACGFSKCTDLKKIKRYEDEFCGPTCAWRQIDLGIAVGSAVKTASILNADNRIMYRIGVVARKLGYIEGDLVIGVPVSATGKNIYFDR